MQDRSKADPEATDDLRRHPLARLLRSHNKDNIEQRQLAHFLHQQGPTLLSAKAFLHRAEKQRTRTMVGSSWKDTKRDRVGTKDIMAAFQRPLMESGISKQLAGSQKVLSDMSQNQNRRPSSQTFHQRFETRFTNTLSQNAVCSSCAVTQTKRMRRTGNTGLKSTSLEGHISLD